MIESCFWTAVVMIVYAYAGYPLVLMALCAVRSRPVRRADIAPRVSVVIAAHNEEGRIRRKIENTLALDYARDQLEVIVASDCSIDRTDEIVRSFGPHGVRLIRLRRRRGKEAAQKLALEESTGDILVFTDVATSLAPDGLRKIVQNFSDPTVGCVSSVDRFIDPDGTVSGEGAYVRYEMFLRRLETRVNTLVGLSGSFFAARRENCGRWAEDLPSDFNTLVETVRRGQRGVLDPESVGFYTNIADEKKEFDRKVRTVLRGISVFMRNLSLLEPTRHGLFSWQLFSHKLCRWLVPFAMSVALAAGAWLGVQSTFYGALLLLQAAFYVVATVGMLLKNKGSLRILRLPSFFLRVNLAILTAWWRYFGGQRVVHWAPSRRPT